MEVDFNKIFTDFYAELSGILPKVISGLIIILIFVVLGKLFFRIIGRRIQRQWKDSIISNFVSQSAKWSFYLMGIIIALNIVGFGGVASSIIAGAGIGAIIIGFAFKDIGENFLAGIILALKRPFEIGDIIEVNGEKGNVKDLDLRITRIRNVEGKDIYIPNSSIIKNTLINYTRDDQLRINFMVGIAPECDIEEARILIIDYLNSNEKILKTPEPNVLVQDLGEFTVDLQVLFWVNIHEKKKSPDSYLGHTIRSKVIIDVKALLDKNNIEMPSKVIEHKMNRDHELKVSPSAKAEDVKSVRRR